MRTGLLMNYERVSMVKYENISLFEVPKESTIIHACNSQGIWGSGIAKAFKEKYPYSYLDYNKFCNIANKERGTACGRASLSTFHESEQHWVGWIVTSHNYGPLKDSPELIKIHTTLALSELCKKIYMAHPKDEWEVIPVYSNKFNSGLFSVPWEDSELILKTVLKDFKRINWIICNPEGI
jgi:ADP-ribose 1''-phosphate phosphatase